MLMECRILLMGNTVEMAGGWHISHQVQNCTQNDVTTQLRSWAAVLKIPKTILLRNSPIIDGKDTGITGLAFCSFTLTQWIHFFFIHFNFRFEEICAKFNGQCLQNGFLALKSQIANIIDGSLKLTYPVKKYNFSE